MMEETKEQFTLATIAKFYTDAAKAGGMEVYHEQFSKWCDTSGPNLRSLVKQYRPKPAAPIVRYAVKNTSGLLSTSTFHTAANAKEWNKHSTDGVVIKLVEEQT